MNPTLPIIHINGTSRETLCLDYENARIALEDAANSMTKIEFNARDYARGDWETAVAQRKAMFQKLEEVRDYLMAHAVHCA